MIAGTRVELAKLIKSGQILDLLMEENESHETGIKGDYKPLGLSIRKDGLTLLSWERKRFGGEEGEIEVK